MRIKLTTILLFILIFFSAISQNDLFLKKQFLYKGDTLPYRILYPANYDKTIQYPLVIFLHGAGERGNDNDSQLKWGSELFTNKQNRQSFPAIVIFPQCPIDRYWAPVNNKNKEFKFVNSKHPTEPMQLLIRLIHEITELGTVDTKRMYVIGLSMGGMGTYDLICRYPKKFAAAIPICGGVSLERLKKIKKIPLRIYHGELDNVVPSYNSYNVYNKLKANGAKNVELIVFPDTNHNSWTPAFKSDDFLEWLFSNKLK